MRQAATDIALSAEQHSGKSTKILLTVAGLMFVGLIYIVVDHDSEVSCPNELIGTWVTSAKGYEEGMLVFSKTGVTMMLPAASCGVSQNIVSKTSRKQN